jgi:deoxyribodipyrimidine photo-lyase
MNQISLFWFRRDLRLDDNNALYHALKSGKPVVCLFIFDKEILSKLTNRRDARVLFIHRQLHDLNLKLQKFGSSLITRYGNPKDVWKNLTREFSIDTVFTNHDYEPYARDRDSCIESILKKHQIEFRTFKDQVVFEKDEVLKDDGKPYTVFTPFKNKWMKTLEGIAPRSLPSEKYLQHLAPLPVQDVIPLKEMGFEDFEFEFPSNKVADKIIKEYAEKRDIPGISGTSRLSIHLRFGTVSIRMMAQKALQLQSTVWLNELIWRDFYQMILWHFPQVVHSSFKPAYDRIIWRNNEADFKAWCTGHTGYPIVDAGMRELNATGFMHNRVRMITASFLVKHLLIDWRWGEAYFAEKLLDFDLASNNGGWQWAAGSGCDAAPYFRIFNPYEQTRKFDPEFSYIRKWVPEFEDFAYPRPVVDHAFARNRCLEVFKKALKEE